MCSSDSWGDGSLGQQPPAVLVDAQRFGLAAFGVQGAHELASEPFPGRMRGRQRHELRDRGAGARRQFGLGQVFADGQPYLGQPCPFRLGEREVRHVGQRRAPPQSERLRERPRGPLVLPRRELRPALPREALEAVNIHLIRVHSQDITWPPGLDQSIGQAPAHSGDGRLDRVGGPVWRGFAVLAVDQRAHGDHPPRRQHQHGQHRARPGTSHLAAAHLNRPQDAEPHTCSLPAQQNDHTFCANVRTFAVGLTSHPIKTGHP
jgi:hypothetical protein